MIKRKSWFDSGALHTVTIMTIEIMHFDVKRMPKSVFPNFTRQLKIAWKLALFLEPLRTLN